MKKILYVIIMIPLVLFFIWFVVSFIDINLHNKPFDIDYLQYKEWNLFKVLF